MARVVILPGSAGELDMPREAGGRTNCEMPSPTRGLGENRRQWNPRLNERGRLEEEASWTHPRKTTFQPVGGSQAGGPRPLWDFPRLR